MSELRFEFSATHIAPLVNIMGVYGYSRQSRAQRSYIPIFVIFVRESLSPQRPPLKLPVQHQPGVSRQIC